MSTSDVLEPSTSTISEPELSVVESTTVAQGDSIDDITQDEFERLLDELHGKGSGPSKVVPKPVVSAVESTPVAPAELNSSDITDDEFEKLLDELHGVGKGPSASDASSSISPVITPKPVVKESSSSSDNGDLMTDEEFEKLLDELHGVGKGPSPDELEVATKPASQNVVSATIEPKVVEVATSPAPAPEKSLPAESKSTAVQTKKPQAEATVRVDTSTLDTIMNMVGELVLVRNRLVSLGLNSNDEEMSKAVSNLDVVTADLQGAVMKTRMQPIKKSLWSFPSGSERSCSKPQQRHCVGDAGRRDRSR